MQREILIYPDKKLKEVSKSVRFDEKWHNLLDECMRY